MKNQPPAFKTNPEKILIIRFSSLGDVALSMPLLHYLRAKFPNCRIDYLVRKEYVEIVQNHPAINRVITFDVREGLSGLLKLRKEIQNAGYDWVLDIHGNLRSRILTFPSWRFKISRIRKNQIIRFLLVKCKVNLYRTLHNDVPKVWRKYLRTVTGDWLEWSAPQMMRVYIDDASIKSALSGLKELGITAPFIVMAPGAKHYTKRWPEKYYTELINRIYGKYRLKTVLLGGPEESVLAENIVEAARAHAAVTLAGKLTIAETAAVIENSTAMVSNDSGLMHLGAAFNKKMAAIFGSTVEELGFFPEGGNVLVLEENGLKCRPCSHIGRSDCPKKHFKCMLNIRPDWVFKKMEENGFFIKPGR